MWGCGLIGGMEKMIAAIDDPSTWYSSLANMAARRCETVSYDQSFHVEGYRASVLCDNSHNPDPNEVSHSIAVLSNRYDRINN